MAAAVVITDKRDDLNFLSFQYFYPSAHKMYSVILLPSPLPPPLAFQLHILFCPLVKKCSRQISNTILSYTYIEKCDILQRRFLHAGCIILAFQNVFRF